MKEEFIEKCCFTGYRPSKLPFDITKTGSTEYIKFENEVLEEILKVCNEGVRTFYTGMAMGFDILAAELVLSLKNAYETPLKLICVLPFEAQCDTFSLEWKERYERILTQCDEKIVLQKEYNKGCYQKRNIFMVDNSDCVLTWYDGKSGGTRNTIDYALKNSRYVFNACKTEIASLGFQNKLDL